MNAYNFRALYKVLAVAFILQISLSACANVPMKDGQLVVSKDTTASIEDFGVASLNSKF